MTLQEATEPLFQYMCRLNRVGRQASAPPRGDTVSFAKRAGVSETAMFGKRAPTGDTSFAKRHAAPLPLLDYAVVRSDIKALFEAMTQKSARDARLSAQIRKMELPLLFFVDSMISESKLPYAQKWNQNRLAFERQELAGDEKFFDLLEETLKDPSDEASERLAVYYTCLGLGFVGFYFNQPDYLRKTMLDILPRIRRLMDASQGEQICPDAYQADDRNLVQPPGARLLFVGILFVCFTMAVVFAYGWLYHKAKADLENAFAVVKTHDLSLPQK